MNKPLVSVIIPVYNAAPYLGRCLDSVLGQTYTHIEVLCVDDCGQDNSCQIIEQYAQKDSRIKLLHNEQNKGAALSRNYGLDEARGEYIYFIDADDYIDPAYIACMVQKIEQTGCDIVLNTAITIESNGRRSAFKHPSLPPVGEEGLFLDGISCIHNAPCFIWARLYRRSFLNRHQLRFLKIHATEDVVFNVMVNLYADKTYIFFGSPYHYTVNDSSVTGAAKTADDRDLWHIRAHSMIYDWLAAHGKLDTDLKLFRVYPFLQVDSAEKFAQYKAFFVKIKDSFIKREDVYNELEKFFAYSLLNSADYEQYLQHYHKNITIGFLRRKK